MSKERIDIRKKSYYVLLTLLFIDTFIIRNMIKNVIPFKEKLDYKAVL